MTFVAAAAAWYIFLAAVIVVFQRRTRFLTELNIFTVFLGCLLLRHGLTVPFDHDINATFAGIELSSQAMVRFYISLVLMYLGLLWGGAFNRRLFPADVAPAVGMPEDDVQPRRTGINLAVALVVIGASTAIVLVTKIQPELKLTELFTGALGAEEYASMRTSFGEVTHYTANIWQRLGSIVFSGLLPAITYTLYFLKDRGVLWSLWFWCTLAVGLVAGIDSLQKAPAAFLLVGLAIAYCYKQGWSRLALIRVRVWIMAAVVVGLVFPFLYRLQYPTWTYTEALESTFHRLSSEHNRSLQLYFEIYPDVQGFMWGSSSGLTNTFLGRNIPVEALPERFIPIYYLGPLYPNTWNACFIGVAWADFGYPGVILESMLLGLLLQAYRHWFARSPKTALVMGTQVGLMMASMKVTEVALTAGLLTFGLGSAFIMYWVLLSRDDMVRPRRSGAAGVGRPSAPKRVVWHGPSAQTGQR